MSHFKLWSLFTQVNSLKSTCLRSLHKKSSAVITLMTLIAVLSATAPAQNNQPLSTAASASNLILQKPILAAGLWDFFSFFGFGANGDEPTSAPVAMRNVCATGAADFTTIQAAVNAAMPGDVIKVCAGSYSESVNFTDFDGGELTINGPQANVDPRLGRTGAEAVLGVGQATAFEISSSAPNPVTKITINGFTFSTDASVGSDPAINLLAGTGSVISNNIFTTSNRRAVYFVNTNGTTFNQNRVSSADGFYGGANDTTISNNLFEGPFDNTIDGAGFNTSRSTTGMPSTGLSVTGNTFTSPTGNFGAIFKSGGEISGNTAIEMTTNPRGASAIFFVGGGNDGLTISNNTISNSGTSAIRFTNFPNFGYGPDKNVSVSSNYLLNNDTNTTDSTYPGSAVRFSTGDGINISANANYIVGNDTGILVDSGITPGVDATNNFYGCNAGPGMTGCDSVGGTMAFTPFAKLDVSASPETISNGGTSDIIARFISSAMGSTDDLPLPNGIPVDFSGDPSVNGDDTTLMNGRAIATFSDVTTSGDRNVNITGTVTPNASDMATVMVDDPAAVANSINRKAGAANPTMASSVTFTVSFNEIVTGVSNDDFTVTKTGNLGGGVSASDVVCTDSTTATTCDVTVSGISTMNGNGTVRLDLKGGTDIRDAGIQSVAGRIGDQTFTVSMSLPADCDADNARRIYNLVDEFSLGGNPNCEFTYGNTTLEGPNSEFVKYQDAIVGAFGVSGIDGWYTDATDTGGVPGIYKNNNTPGNSPPDGTTTYEGTVAQPIDRLNLHPGIDGQRSVIRFKVPTGGSGFYKLDGSFKSLDIAGARTDVKIIVRRGATSTPVFESNLTRTPNGDLVTFSNVPVVLEVNDIIDFSVGFGTDGYGSDSTGLKATITPADLPTATITGPATAITENDNTTTPQTATFTVTVTGDETLPATVSYSTADVSATGGTSCSTGVDYITETGNLTIPASTTPGTGVRTGSITIDVCNDDIFESPSSETFSVTIGNSTDTANSTNAVVAASPNDKATATITEDDVAPKVDFDAATYSFAEGNSGTTTATIKVNRSGSVGAAETVNYSITSGSATGGAMCAAGTDYVTPSGTFSIPANMTSGTFDISICPDSVFENGETVNLSLTGTNVGTTQPTTVLTITNDDTAPTFSINSRSLAEGTATPPGTTAFVFTITKTGSTELASSVVVNTANGTPNPTDGSDFTPLVNQTVSFTATETSQQVTVLVNSDAMNEQDETFFVNLSSQTGATIPSGQGQGTGTIQNDDFPFVRSIIRSNPTAQVTNATSVVFAVTFNEPVENVDANDFVVTTVSGTFSPAPSVQAVNTASPFTTYFVTVAVSGNGVIRLDLIDNNTIVSSAGMFPLGGPGANNGSFTNGETYIIDQAGPMVTLNQATTQPDPTSAAPIRFTAVFNEPIDPATFTAADVTVAEDSATPAVTGTAFSTAVNSSVEITPITGAGITSNTRFTVTVSGMNQSGNVTVSIAGGIITDVLGNQNTASTSSAGGDTVYFAQETLYALTNPSGTPASQSLITFNSTTPNSASAPLAITGLAANETLVGIDFRPRNRVLYALGVTVDNGTTPATRTGRVYTVNTLTGRATAVGTGSIALRGTEFGFDFNPTAAANRNLIRVVSNAGQNLRLDPDSGAVAGVDTDLNPATTGVAAAGYTNSDADTTTGTTLYVIDTVSDTLFIQNPPNAGMLTMGKPLGIDAGDINGFDISSFGAAAGNPNNINTGYAAFSSNDNGAGSILYNVDLANGTASPVGAIRVANTTSDLLIRGLTATPQGGALQDNTGPATTLTATTVSPTNDSSISFTAAFTNPNSTPANAPDPVTDFDDTANTADVTVATGTGTAFSSSATPVITITPIDGSSYTVSVSGMDRNGSVTANVNAGAAVDLQGNPNTASTPPITVVYDALKPALDITAIATTFSMEPITFMFEFDENGVDENVTDFTVEDITVTNGTVVPGSFTTEDGNTYTVRVSPTMDGNVTVTVADNVATDAADNGNIGDTLTVGFDTTGPVGTITQATGQPDPTSASPIRFTASFNEPINPTTFTSEDVVVATGDGTAFLPTLGTPPTGTPAVAIQAITGEGITPNTRFTVSITGMNRSGTVSITVAAARVADTLGNTNAAAFTNTDNTVYFAQETLYALTNPTVATQQAPSTQSLIRFSSTNPNSAGTPLTITGLATGETLVGIDFRPLNNVLYGLGVTVDTSTSTATRTGRIYTVNSVTGTATAVGAGGIVLEGTEFGFDFNPAANDNNNLIRVISDTGQNLRVSPNTGALVGTDTALTINGVTATDVTGAGYTNSDRLPGTATTIYDVSAATDTLYLQGGLNGTLSPNGGVLTAVGTGLGIDVGTINGFDISSFNAPANPNIAYGAFGNQANAAGSSLYTVGLTDGTASLVGVIGDGTLIIRGLTAAPFGGAAEDNTGPTTTITQAMGQADPTNASPINFMVEFNEPVTGFTNTDVTVSGTAFSTSTPAGTSTVVVTPAAGGAIYNVAVSGMTTNGTVVINIGSGVAVDLQGNGNMASVPTEGDNTVTYSRPAISINDVTVVEGNSGTTTTAQFTVTLTGAITEAVTVNYATANGTTNPAAAGSDYASASSMLTFAPSAMATQTQIVEVTINGDAIVEPDETFFVNLSGNSSNSTVSDAQGVGTIDNDDVTVSFSSATYSVGEDGDDAGGIDDGVATITVTRNGIPAGTTPADVTVNYATSNGTAVTPADYGTAVGTVTFASATLTTMTDTRTFTVSIVDDAISEPPTTGETVNLTLSSPSSNAVIAPPGTAVLSIIDNDGGGTVFISGRITQTTSTGSGLPNVTVTLSGDSSATVKTDSTGNYSFMGLSSGGEYFVTPSCPQNTTPTCSASFVFDPSSREYRSIMTSVTNANFLAFNGDNPRNIRVVNTYQPTISSDVSVPIFLDSRGDENSVNFNLNYSSSRLTYLLPVGGATCGSGAPAGCTVTITPITGGLSILVDLPPGITFAAGAREIVRLDFDATPVPYTMGTANAAEFNTPVTFDMTAGTFQVSNTQGAAIPADFVDGLVIFAQGFEGDIAGGAPNNSGIPDGMIVSGDITRLRGIFARSITPNPNVNEFQRADVAPFSSRGDGVINSGDVTVMRRYALGGDLSNTKIFAQGPSQPVGSTSLAELMAGQKTVKRDSSRLVPGDFRVVNRTGTLGQRVTVPIELDSRGQENSFNFSIDYEEGKLSNPVVALGSGTATVQGVVLTTSFGANGRIGILVDFASGVTLTAGTKQIITVTFDVNVDAATGMSPITFVDTPFGFYTSDVNGDPLPSNYVMGSVNISAAPTAGTATIGGRVVSASGKAVSGATVTLTAPSGNVVRTRTNPKGVYRFDEVPTGTTYVIGVSTKFNAGSSQTVNLVDSLANVDFILQD